MKCQEAYRERRANHKGQRHDSYWESRKIREMSQLGSEETDDL